MDLQLLIVSVAALAAGLYAIRRVALQFQRPDDEPAGCHGCPANPSERLQIKVEKREDAEGAATDR